MMAPKEKKPSIVEFFRNLSGLMMDEEPNALSKSGLVFPRRFLVTDNWVLLESDENGIVKTCTQKDVCGAVSKFLDENLPSESYKWTAKTIRDFVDHWMLLVPQIPMPKPWVFASDKSLAFHRLPWDLGEAGPTPTWDELLGRMTNAAAFKVWVGSLFDEKSDRQTYIWLYGSGQNGKGAILRFLRQVFGLAFASEIVPGRNDRFWTHGLLGKRVVAFADTNEAGFPATGLFKSLTGNDAIRMEIKGGATFCSDILAMFIFASNDRPGLSSECADMRRAILCELSPIAGDANPHYGDLLWAEGGAFIGSCHRDYLALGGRPVRGDLSNLEAWVGELEDHFDSVLHEHFELAVSPKIVTALQIVDHNYNNDAPPKELPHVEAKIMSLVLHRLFSNRHDIRGFYSFLERKYGVKRTTVRLSHGVRENRYLNISLRDSWDFRPRRHVTRNPDA